MKPQGFLAALSDASDEEVVYLSNASAGKMEAYPEHLQGALLCADLRAPAEEIHGKKGYQVTYTAF